jgi:hypothetical protein
LAHYAVLAEPGAHLRFETPSKSSDWCSFSFGQFLSFLFQFSITRTGLSGFLLIFRRNQRPFNRGNYTKRKKFAFLSKNVRF